MIEYLELDFEYNESSEKNLNLVCCATTFNGENPKKWWLYNNKEEQAKLARYLLQFKDSDVLFHAFNVEAEARSLLSMDVDPLYFKWFDSYLEYRNLLNHNHQFMFGKQMIGGKVVRTFPPKNKWTMTEEEKKKYKSRKPEYNLVAATFKLLGECIDSDHKKKIRDIIISNVEIEENKEKIMEYCLSDIQYLPRIKNEILANYKKLYRKSDIAFIRDDVLERSEYAVRTAMMGSLGYPVNSESMLNFSNSVGSILSDCAKDINRQFPDKGFFEYRKKDGLYTRKEKPLMEWIETTPYSNRWLLTDTKRFSLSLDAFEQHYTFKHDYPEGNVGAQQVRYLKLKQSLNGFSPSSDKSIWDNLGSDGRVRPFFNIYGSQSSRTQPSATSFIPLKAAWMRSLIQPVKGKAIAGIDFKSQEFLISSLLSNDKNMIDAYMSGDVYLYFAKLAGAVPWDGERKDHEKTRDQFKTVVLGISYGMGPVALADELTKNTGREHDKFEAKEFIAMFADAFPDYWDWRVEQLDIYADQGYLKLADGWTMWGDNLNERSIQNMPVQGHGAVVMRDSVRRSQNNNLDVIFTLHDALYIEYDSYKFDDVLTLRECMFKSFQESFPKKVQSKAIVGLDINTWGPDYVDGELDSIGDYPCKFQSIYVDGRAVKEYEKFKKYFKRDPMLDLI